MLALGFVGGCAATDIDLHAPPLAETAYTALYPYYAEVCAVSEINKLPGYGAEIRSGGQGGHAVLYLNGVCRDTSAGYPVIGLCDQNAPATERGVGLSANAHFANANWVAVPGRDFFLHGDLAPDEALTRTAYQRTLAKAEAMGLYDGILFHPAVMDARPADMSTNDYRYDISIGTDYAVDFARNRDCARTPVSRAQMGRIVDHLNEVNQPYRSGEKSFVWNVLQNNCSHLTHNALGAACVWDDWQVEQFPLFAAFDFPVPKNEFVNQMRRGNDMDLADLDGLYADEAARQDLLLYDRLPTAPGVLAETGQVIAPNDVYKTNSRLIFYDDPLLGNYQADFNRIVTEPRYFDLIANLRYFSALYHDLRAQLRPVESYRSYRTEPAAFADFYTRYAAYIDRQSRLVDGQLASLTEKTISYSVPSLR